MQNELSEKEEKFKRAAYRSTTEYRSGISSHAWKGGLDARICPDVVVRLEEGGEQDLSDMGMRPFGYGVEQGPGTVYFDPAQMQNDFRRFQEGVAANPLLYSEARNRELLMSMREADRRSWETKEAEMQRMKEE